MFGPNFREQGFLEVGCIGEKEPNHKFGDCVSLEWVVLAPLVGFFFPDCSVCVGQFSEGFLGPF